MDSTLGLAMLWALFGCRGGSRETSAPELPEPGWPGAPVSYPTTSTPPWPQVVPSTDDSLRVKLTPRPRNRHVRPITPPANEPQPLPPGETLPNPY